MSTSGTELKEALAQSVSVSDDALVAELADGRTITVPLAWFPRLAHGTPAERANWFLSRNCHSAAKQPLPYGRGSDGFVETTRLGIRAATVRERSYARKPSFATETS